MTSKQTHNRKDRPYTFYRLTQSTCPDCLKLVQAQVIIEDNQVYLQKTCPEHGPSKALVSEDADYYKRAYAYTKPGSIPHQFQTETKYGCPTDCGLCPSHQQHTCLPIIEITDHCNLECPICIVNNKNAKHMSKADFKDILERLIAQEGYLETITLSGGEPTLHPEFMELIDLARQYPEIGRLSVVTNGLRIAQSQSFCEALKQRNVYVILQMDGFSDVVHQKVRGRSLQKEKEMALHNLAEFDIATQIAFVPIRGINEDQLGKAVELLLERKHILSLMIQPVSYSGKGGANFPHDPLDRLTIPGVLKNLEQQTNGLVTKKDFVPLPCSHPLCVSLTYMLRLDDGSYVPFSRFMDFKNNLELLQQTATINPDEKTEYALQTAISDLWSTAGEIPNSTKILKALKRALLEMYPGHPVSKDELRRISERQAKTIFIHHYMDRYDFDIERVVKCCHHYPQIDGRVMPACSFNLFYRGTDK